MRLKICFGILRLFWCFNSPCLTITVANQGASGAYGIDGYLTESYLSDAYLIDSYLNKDHLIKCHFTKRKFFEKVNSRKNKQISAFQLL